MVVGELRNRGAGNGLELLCEFKFQGDKFSYEEKLKRKTLMYCNERKQFTWTLASYALYCSDSNTAFMLVSAWLNH